MSIGEKVVCVDDSPARNRGDFVVAPQPLKKGQVYVVTDYYKTRLGMSVRLIGVTVTRNGKVTGFLANRFRPLAELKAESKTKQTDTVSNITL